MCPSFGGGEDFLPFPWNLCTWDLLGWDASVPLPHCCPIAQPFLGRLYAHLPFPFPFHSDLLPNPSCPISHVPMCALGPALWYLLCLAHSLSSSPSKHALALDLAQTYATGAGWGLPPRASMGGRGLCLPSNLQGLYPSPSRRGGDKGSDCDEMGDCITICHPLPCEACQLPPQTSQTDSGVRGGAG